MSVDDSSSANESSSEATTNNSLVSKSNSKNLKKLKRPPPPKANNGIFKHNDFAVPETSSDINPEAVDNNNVLGLVNCAVCGKQFGKNSIKFHLKQCQKRQQILKERQEASALEDKKVTKDLTIEEAEDSVPYIHEAIWEAHVQQLIPCTTCGRTFFPDRIQVIYISNIYSVINISV